VRAPLRGLLLAVAASVACAGCSDQKIDAVVKKLFEPRRSPQQYMIVAVSESDPDARREAVAQVANSKDFTHDWAVKGLVAIALLESDPQTRCVAIRGLTRARDPRAAETLLKILNFRDYDPGEVRPPDDLVRGDATAGLASLSDGAVADELRPKVRETLLGRVRSDTDRHVRIAAARGLAHYRDADSVQGLIAGLRDDDFAVVHRCEQSLAELTGVTHDCDVYAWEQWFEANREDLFARAGTLPESRRPAYTNHMEQAWHDTREFLEWLFPGKKE